ncbi:MAG: hypothetical protein ACK47B_06085 [Armatimonadota bacterium]
MNEPVLRELYQSLDQRWRPENVAEKLQQLLGAEADRSTAARLRKVAEHARPTWWTSWLSSMPEDFARPVGMGRQLERARVLFDTPERPGDLNLVGIREYLETISARIVKSVGHSDFKADRLNRTQRREAGLGEISRRRYNKLFRLAGRMEQKLAQLARELEKREFTLVSKSRLASRLTWEEFSQDRNTACFLAYYVARCNLRSEFTISGQQKPYDELCDALFQRCRASATTNWWALAHAFPDREVLEHLTEEQKGWLLGMWYDVLYRIGRLLHRTWERSSINRETMIVRRGNDSSTWNITAGAWNRAREGWIAVVYALGMEEILERQCLGKVLRLMAADVARWHRVSGGDLDPDTKVWAELPLPWDVLSGEAECSRAQVEAVCGRHGVDPVKKGWAAPRPGRQVQAFRPTPELVHGVAIASPELATLLRKAGWFSAKVARPVEREVVVLRDEYGFALGAADRESLMGREDGDE